MKNNKTKIGILIIGIAGYIFVGVKNMPKVVAVSFIIGWTIFILGTLFAFSPEIKRIIFKKNTIEMEHFKKQVDKALVEYDEFKKTIYPLLEASMGQIVAVRYLQAPPKSSIMLSYVPLVEKVIKTEHLNQPEIQELFEAIKVMTLYGLSVELGKIVSVASDGKIDQEAVERLFELGMEDDYSKKAYVYPDDVDVDWKTLDEIDQKLPDNKDKHRYERRLKQLKDFYNKYYSK